MTFRDEARAAISNAYYDARNAGKTMEDAADMAADAVLALLPIEGAQCAYCPSGATHIKSGTRLTGELRAVCAKHEEQA